MTLTATTTALPQLHKRVVKGNIWLGTDAPDALAQFTPRPFDYEVLPDENAVGRAMLQELQDVARTKTGDIVFLLLGGRGAQALHRQLGALAETNAADDLLARLRVFTQDALAPLRGDNAFSFVRDFERLLGPAFFAKVKSFTAMSTATADLESGLIEYAEQLTALGGIDIFFLGLGPEAAAASHLAYIKPHSGATVNDWAGLIPISESILEHHIAKFQAGGVANDTDEAETRRARHILTLGPAAILGARRVVQSIVDADTAPAKRASFRRVVETALSNDVNELAAQLDANPGLWLRLHPNRRTLVLPDLLT